VDDLLAYFQSLLKYAQNNAANLNPASQKALGELILLFSQTIEEQSNKMAEQGDINAIEREQAKVSEQVAQPPSGTPPTGGNIPPLQPAPHESSNINAFRYNPENQQLFVKFQGKYPQQNGPVYKYEGVPDFIFNVFSRGAVGPKTSGSNGWHTWKKGVTPSHGAAMAALIKNGGYQYTRMS
jgi:KTSC domain